VISIKTTSAQFVLWSGQSGKLPHGRRMAITLSFAGNTPRKWRRRWLGQSLLGQRLLTSSPSPSIQPSISSITGNSVKCKWLPWLTVISAGWKSIVTGSSRRISSRNSFGHVSKAAWRW